MTRAQFSRWRALAIVAVRTYRPTLVSVEGVPVPSLEWMERMVGEVLDAVDADGLDEAPPGSADLMDMVMCVSLCEEALATEPPEVFDGVGGLLPAHEAWVALWIDSMARCLRVSLAEALS